MLNPFVGCLHSCMPGRAASRAEVGNELISVKHVLGKPCLGLAPPWTATLSAAGRPRHADSAHACTFPWMTSSEGPAPGWSTGRWHHNTCAQAVQMLVLVLARVQSMHMCGSTTYSTTKVCCRMAPFRTSACTVSFTLIRLLCGSVHTKPASTSFTCVARHTALLPDGSLTGSFAVRFQVQRNDAQSPAQESWHSPI